MLFKNLKDDFDERHIEIRSLFLYTKTTRLKSLIEQLALLLRIL